MPNLQESTRNEFVSALRANISFLKKNFPKIKNADVCQNSCNVVDVIENKLRTSTDDFTNISNNIEKFTNFISESGLFKRISFDEISDNRYQVTVRGCELAQQCIHPRLNPERIICPMAFLAASFLKYNDSKTQIFIEQSKFTAQDSETTIILIDKN